MARGTGCYAKGGRSEAGPHASVRGIVLDLTARKEQERERQREVKQKYEGQLRLLASELAQAEQRERDRMAQVLHDHLQQLLVAAKFQVRSLVKFRMLNPDGCLSLRSAGRPPDAGDSCLQIFCG